MNAPASEVAKGEGQRSIAANITRAMPGSPYSNSVATAIVPPHTCHDETDRVPLRQQAAERLGAIYSPVRSPLITSARSGCPCTADPRRPMGIRAASATICSITPLKWPITRATR